ncbi:hypothetical protein RJ640_025237 [Escallonia rubra]|uniref:Uncharacterized protein n=1 Tax=Escallonia rubra TaxID=112253 RepID=A0AA88QWW3_9ASTE|nr:hypothetical protein RJ640_025237 [Escallonia rubra]
MGARFSRGALEVAELTLKCLEVDPKKRPSMKEVLKTLEIISAIKMETMKEEVRGLDFSPAKFWLRSSEQYE